MYGDRSSYTLENCTTPTLKDEKHQTFFDKIRFKEKKHNFVIKFPFLEFVEQMSAQNLTLAGTSQLLVSQSANDRSQKTF